MKANAGKYLNRPIGENEDELLDEIWSSLPSVEDEEQMLDNNYRDVKQRIHKHILKRRIVWFSSCAAAVCLFMLLLSGPQISEVSPEYAQLSEMGVSVREQKVQFMIGDSVVANLNRAARMHVGQDAKMSLQAATGEKIVLEEEKVLKIHVPAGKRFELELADGSRVWLNADTWFEYPATFVPARERRVKLEGEGFFEVRPDATKPFYVEIPGGESIRVLGTSFNISAYSDNEENVTTLVTGKIEYSLPERTGAIALSPTEQVRVNKMTKRITKNEVNTSEFDGWKEGILYFNNEKLSVLAKRLARMYGIGIQVSEEYEDSRFSGMIRYERGIEYIIKLLTTTSNMKCIIENGIIYLK